MVTKVLLFWAGGVLGTTAGLMLGSWLSRDKTLDEIRNYHFKLQERKSRDGYEAARTMRGYLDE